MKILSRMLRPLRAHTPLVLLVLIALAVAVANFDSKTWLTGWDTLHPEFNFALNFSRLLAGVWREDQGLGAVAAHAHMADLPRVVILWLMSLVAPRNTVKLLYDLACLVIGPIGIYALVAYTLKTYTRTTTLVARYTALVVGTWYLFNLGTVQHFYVVFEMFAVQYAAIGWLFLLALRYQEEKRLNDLVLFGLVSLLAAPQAYASTLWFALAGGLAVTVITLSLVRGSWKHVWRGIQVGLVLFLTNAFWLLPNLYFLGSGASDNPKYAHINELFSVEAFLQNRAFGTINHLALLRNFLFNWSIFSQSSGKFEPLMKVWIAHTEQPLILGIGYGFAFLVLFGLSLLLKKRFARLAVFFPAWMIALFMLINENPPFTALFSWLRSQSSFFEEGLRFPFTKFSLLFMVATAVVLSGAIAQIIDWLRIGARRYTSRQTVPLIAIVPVLLLMLFGWPLLQGELIVHKLHRSIPDPYVALFDFFATEPAQTRVLQLPMQTLHGWDYYNWGYEGPGFVWFGIPQAYVVRDFDRWNADNETLYKQFSTALYALDHDAFASYLRKYDISYVVIDGSITAPQSRSQAVTWVGESKRLLTDIGAELVWEDEYLSVYQIPGSPKTTAATKAPFHQIETDDQYTHADPAFQTVGNYISPISERYHSLPFARILEDRPSVIFDRSNDLLIQGSVSQATDARELVLPALKVGDPIRVRTQVAVSSEQVTVQFSPAAYVKRGDQTVPVAQLPTLELALAEPLAASELTINNQPFLLTNDQPEQEAYLTLLVGGPITVTAQTPLGGSATQTFPSSIWDSLLVEQRFTLEPVAEAVPLELLVTKPEVTAYLGDLLAAKELNCDLYQRGRTEFVSDSVKSSLDLLATEKGAVCIGTNLAPYSNQLVQITGQNNEGRSLKVYIENERTQRVELEHLLANGAFNELFAVFQQTDSIADDRWISLENRSVAGELSSNHISSVVSYSVPISFDYFSRISLAPTDPSPVLPSVTVLASDKRSAAHYTVRIAPVTDTSAVLAFSQAYDAGWVAFYGSDVLNPLSHVQLNSWENGWIVEPDAGSQVITIFFWPQLLQFVGFLLLGGVGAWMLWVVSTHPDQSLPERHLLRSRRLQSNVRRVLG